MAYTGNVRVGGPPDVRELAALTVSKVSVGPMDNNAYLLRCRKTGTSCLVDAANDEETLVRLLSGEPLERVVTTHRHADHWQALAAVVAATGARTAAGRLDADGIPIATVEPLDDGDELVVGEVRLTVVHLVGHTPGSIALRYDDPAGFPHVLTGDSLFPGGVGNTFGSRRNFERLYADVTEKLFGRLPDDAWIYPGHGRDTTIGAERPHLGEWRDRGW